jgi:hypothetical protein
MHLVVTLVEGDFLYGACALFNSLVNNGFSDKFVIGYRDKRGMPTRALEAISRAVEDRIDWKQLDTPMHFGNYKPRFMQSVFDRYPEAEKVTYMDPDIVCLAPFKWIDSWSHSGPAVCADVNWLMPADHPIRRAWIEISRSAPQRRLDYYFNSGFLSVARRDAAFLSLWAELIETLGARDNTLEGKGDIANWRKGGRWMPFRSPNQDTLNLALTVWDGDIVALGPDVMGFTASGILPHALGADKPWRKGYLRHALAGRPPSAADRAFWKHAHAPIRPFSEARRLWSKAGVALASALGRFYRGA